MKHNWEYKQLTDIATSITPRIKVDKSDYLLEGPVPIISQEESYISGYWDNLDDITPHNGPVIIFGDHSRVLKYVDCDFVVGADGVKIISPKDCICAKFLFHFLKWYNIPSLGYSRHFKLIKDATFPVPPREVQERIVAELDKINETIEDCRELLRNLDALAQSLFYDFFGDPVTNPKGWEIKKLDEICRAISTGITYKPDNVADIGTIVLRSSNIQNSSFVLDDIVHIDMSLKPSQYVQKNDILMCSRNGSARLVGKVALIPQLNEKMSWGAFMTIIRSDYYHYLFQFFRLPAFREQLTKTKTTTVNQITIGMLKKIQIPMPPLSLQEQFASRIEQIEAQKKAVEETIENLQTLLDSRMDYWFN